MIRFKHNTTLDIVDRFDEAKDEIAEQHEETFKAGELVDADIVGEPDQGRAEIQFADGSVAYGVPVTCFEEVTKEQQEEQRRRDEKHGLYGEHEDPAN